MRRITEKIGNEIEIFSLGKLNVHLSIEFTTGNIKVYDTYIVSDADCAKIPCTSVNNVTTLYMRLIIRLSDKNLVILNIPDIVIWLAKVYGIDKVYSVLSLVHDYVEKGVFDDHSVDEVLSIINRWGVNINRDSFVNATLPGRKSLEILREILSHM
jgi:hypothetical protein